MGKPPLGFTRTQKYDDSGALCVDSDGDPIYELAIDPETAEIRRRMGRLLVDEKMSPHKIAKLFNKQRVDDWDGWTASGIRKLLWSASAVGVFIWNRCRREFDIDSETYVKVENPRSEWEVSNRPEIAIISLEEWKHIRKELLKRKRKTNRPKKSRNQIKASTLFSGTLFCSECGRELLLSRSAGKYRNMMCPNGQQTVRGCTMDSNKSCRIIESSLLSFLLGTVVSESRLQRMVDTANAFISDAQKEPKTDTKALKRALKKVNGNIDKYMRFIDEDEDEENDCLAYRKKIKQFEAEARVLRKKIADAKRKDDVPTQLLDAKRLSQYLPKVREALQGDVANAAELIRDLTGEIKIRQEPYENGKRGARWIAEFIPELVNILGRFAPTEDCPDSIPLEFLRTRNWTMNEKVEVAIEQTTKAEQQAAVFADRFTSGKSIQEIADDLQVSWYDVLEGLVYVETGLRPDWDGHDVSDNLRYAGWDDFEAIAQEVLAHHKAGLSWSQIAQLLGNETGQDYSVAAVLRAYEFSLDRPTRIRRTKGRLGGTLGCRTRNWSCSSESRRKNHNSAL